jgi:Protein of unknown function (DUF3892)
MSTKQAQVMCINKSDRMNAWERIKNVGGSASGQWKITQEQAIKYIEAGEWQFFVSVGGKSVWVVVAESRFGNKYLRTQADKGEENNLLSLPECP